MNQEWLEQLVRDGKSITEIANASGKGKSTVRHWLAKYKLVTSGISGGRKLHPETATHKTCASCESALPFDCFRQRKDRNCLATNCKKCEAAAAANAQNATKRFCVDYKGGKCVKCNMMYELSQYAFHHTDPKEKDFSLSEHRRWSIVRLQGELDKCILVCHNCHAEIHNEITKKNGYKNKIQNNSERWVLSKQVHLEWIEKDSCDSCGYNKYQGALSIILPDGLERINTIYINNDEYGLALKRSTVLCINCLRK